MSGDDPYKGELLVAALCVSGTASPLADTARMATEAASCTGGLIFTTMESMGTAIRTGAEPLVIAIWQETEPARVEPPAPVLHKKTAYERANPNQPFYAKLRREDKKKGNLHGRRKK